MKAETELNRLTKENENFRKIIKIQQNTITRMVDYFILREQMLDVETEVKKAHH